MKKIPCLVLAMLLLPLSVMMGVSADGENQKEPFLDAYIYPVLPGSNAWGNLKNAEEKRDACSVDETLLKQMTTDALIETIVTYPLFIDVFAYDYISDGFSALAGYFGGVEELKTRDDALDRLKAYSAGFDAGSLELKAINTDALIFYFENLPGESEFFIEDYARNLLEGEECGEDIATGMTRSGYGSAIYTPNGTEVPATIQFGSNTVDNRLYNLTWADHGTTYARAKAISDGYPLVYSSLSPVAPINPAYNCHSYAWYSQSTTNKYWINWPNVYILDQSYVASTAAAGRKVTYLMNGVISHSGIVYTAGADPVIESKWGILGVYRHNLDDCPYVGSNVTNQYWV